MAVQGWRDSQELQEWPWVIITPTQCHPTLSQCQQHQGKELGENARAHCRGLKRHCCPPSHWCSYSVWKTRKLRKDQRGVFLIKKAGTEYRIRFHAGGPEGPRQQPNTEVQIKPAVMDGLAPAARAITEPVNQQHLTQL